jgi:hypothetical protein
VFLPPFEWYAGRTALLADLPVQIERVLSPTQALVRSPSDPKGTQWTLDGALPELLPCFPPPGSVMRGATWMPSPDANSDWAGYHCDVCAHGADLGIAGAREAWEYLIALRRLGGPGRYYWGFKHSVEPR